MKYRLTLTVDAKHIAAIVEAAYDAPNFDPAMTIERIDEPEPQSKKRLAMRGAAIAEAAKRIKTPVRRGKIRHHAAVNLLFDEYPAVSKELGGWQNKSKGLHGWDRWLKANHPDAARSLWPDWSGK